MKYTLQMMSGNLLIVRLFLPEINQSSSSTTPLQKTRLVVNSGNWLAKLNLIWAPNFDIVPVPVRSPLTLPFLMISLMRSRYWYSSCGLVAIPTMICVGDVK